MLYVFFGVASVATLAAGLVPGWSDGLLLSLPCAVASLFLLLRGRRRKPRAAGKWVIIDGSNVMHWQDGEPDLAPVREVIGALRQAGYTPGIMFDANAGYKLEGRYLHDTALAKRLNLPRENVMVVPKNTPADPMILTAARDYGAPVVTRDKFRDWIGDFPEIAEAGFLISGGYDGARLRLNLPG